MKNCLFCLCLLFGIIGSMHGQGIKSVKIGNQVWMAENMKIPVPGSWCYNDDPAMGNKYGRLYTWDAAKNVCPKGWRLPTEKDWDQLISFLGGEDIAGSKMKVGGSSGLNVLLGGMTSVGNFRLINSYGTFWCATSYDAEHAWYFYVTSSGPNITKTYFTKNYGFSVRCIKEN